MTLIKEDNDPLTTHEEIAEIVKKTLTDALPLSNTPGPVDVAGEEGFAALSLLYLDARGDLFIKDQQNQPLVWDGTDVTIGATNSEYVKISGTGLQFFNGSTERFRIDIPSNDLIFYGDAGEAFFSVQQADVSGDPFINLDATALASNGDAHMSLQSNLNSIFTLSGDEDNNNTGDARITFSIGTAAKAGIYVDASDSDAFKIESNDGGLNFNNAGTGDITINSSATAGSPTNRLTIDMDKLKIGTGSRYAEFQSLDTDAPALYFVNNDGDPPQPTDGAVIYAKDNDLYRRSSDGTVAIAAWGTGGGTGTIDTTADYSMTGTWSFSPSSGKSVPSFQPYASGAPFTIGSNGFDQVVSRLNADLLDGDHASVFTRDAAGVGTTIVGNWTFTPTSGDDFPRLPKNTWFNQADDGTAPFQVTSTEVVANLQSDTTALAANSTLFNSQADTVFAKLAGNETVTGDYTFEGAVDFNPTLVADKITVKSGALKIGAKAAAEAPFSLTAPYSGTIVSGLNVQYLNGYEDTSFIRPATATVNFTGDWTFNPSGTLPFTVAAGKTDVVLRLNADLLDGNHAEAFLFPETSPVTIGGNWTFLPNSGGNFPDLPKQTYFSESSLAPFQVVSTAVVANLHATNSDQLGGTAAASYATDAEVATLLTGYANLSEDETVAGDYTFTGELKPNSGSLKIGAKAAAEAPFSLTAPHSLTVVTGLNADYVDGIHGTALANTAQTEEITGTWTFSTPPAFTQSTGSSPFTVSSITAVANLRSATSELATNSLELGGVTAVSYTRNDNAETIDAQWTFEDFPIKFKQITAPGEPADTTANLWYDVSDNGLWFRDHNTEGNHNINLLSGNVASSTFADAATTSQTTYQEFRTIAPTTPDQTYAIEVSLVGRGTAGSFDNGFVYVRAYAMFYTNDSAAFVRLPDQTYFRTPSTAKDGSGSTKTVTSNNTGDFDLQIIDSSDNIVVKARGHNSSDVTPNAFSWKCWTKVYQV